MSDLVKRLREGDRVLRAAAPLTYGPDPVMARADDEIERLNARINSMHNVKALIAENVALRSALNCKDCGGTGVITWDDQWGEPRSDECACRAALAHPKPGERPEQRAVQPSVAHGKTLSAADKAAIVRIAHEDDKP